MANNIKKILTERGIRPTPVRLIVLEYFQSIDHALSLNSVEAGITDSDKVTLYRTLKTFEEKGILHKVDDGSGIAKYALCDLEREPGEHNDTHLHFSCTQCGETYCLPKTKIPDIVLPEDFKPQAINLTVKGICHKCKQK